MGKKYRKSPGAQKKTRPNHAKEIAAILVDGVPCVRDGAVAYYCDGSCPENPGTGGWGWCRRDGDGWIEGCGGQTDATNNMMELAAVIEAIIDAKNVFGAGAKIDLLSDSQYVVKGCVTWRHGWKARGWHRAPSKRHDGELQNRAIWIELSDLLDQMDAKVWWVPGHCGIEGNERSDRLAEAGYAEACDFVVC